MYNDLAQKFGVTGFPAIKQFRPGPKSIESAEDFNERMAFAIISKAELMLPENERAPHEAAPYEDMMESEEDVDKGEPTKEEETKDEEKKSKKEKKASDVVRLTSRNFDKLVLG